LFDRTSAVLFSLKKHPELLAATWKLLRISHANRLPFGPEQLSAEIGPGEFFDRQQSVAEWSS
jgi:hypothetical protein